MRNKLKYTKYVDMSLSKSLGDLCLLGSTIQHYWIMRLSADVNLRQAENVFKRWLDSFRKRYPQVAGIYVKTFPKCGGVCFHILLGEWNGGGLETGYFRVETEYDSEGEPTVIQIPISSSEVYGREIWDKLRAKHGKLGGAFEAQKMKTNIYGNPNSEIIRQLTNPKNKGVSSGQDLARGFKFWGFINKLWFEREPLRETEVERFYEDGTLLWKIGEGRWISFDDASNVLSKDVFDEIWEKARHNPIFTPEEAVRSLQYC